MSDKKWQLVSEEEVFKTPYFSISKNRFSNSPEYQDDFYRFNFSDWVNVVPETETGDFVMIRIFRFGISGYSLEFPGGQVDEGSSPEKAASDELLQETGYTSRYLHPVGWVHPNPANQNNRCFLYHATHVSQRTVQRLEDAEDISIEIVPKKDLPQMISRGKITHTLSLLAYYYSQSGDHHEVNY
jgi:ADP-ribose pyrophosphatase